MRVEGVPVVRVLGREGSHPDAFRVTHLLEQGIQTPSSTGRMQTPHPAPDFAPQCAALDELAELERLKKEYPLWRIWRGNLGWYVDYPRR